MNEGMRNGSSVQSRPASRRPERSGRSAKAKAAGRYAHVLARLLLAAALVVTPLLWGGRHPMAIGLAGLLASAAFLLWGAGVLLRGRCALVPARGLWLLLPALLLLLLQCVPEFFTLFPAAPLEALWKGAVRICNVGSARFALSPEAQKNAILAVAAVTLTYWLSVQLFSRRDRWVQLVLAVILAGGLTAIAGLVQLFAGLDWVLWLKKPLARSASAGFPNRDHFAQFCALGFFVTAGFLTAFLSAPQGSRLAALIGGRRKLLILPGLLAVADLLAVIFSYSRAAILTTLTGLVIFAATAFLARGRRGGSAVLVTAGAAVLITGFYGFDLLIDRVAFVLSGTDPSALIRKEIWATTLEVIRKSPWFGSGWDAVRTLSPTLDTSYAPGTIINAAHCDYLELLAMLGLPLGGLILLGGAVLYAKAHLGLKRGWRSRSSFFLLALGMLTGITVVLLHEAVEYGLLQPANLMLFSATGAALGIVLEKMKNTEGGSLQPVLGIGRTGMLVIVLAGITALSGAFWNRFISGRAQAELEVVSEFASSNRTVNDRVLQDGRLQAAEKVLALDSGNPVARTARTEALFRLAEDERREREAKALTALLDRPVSAAQVDRSVYQAYRMQAFSRIPEEDRKHLSDGFEGVSEEALKLAALMPSNALALSMAAGALDESAYWRNAASEGSLKLHAQAVSLYPWNVTVLSRAVRGLTLEALKASPDERAVLMEDALDIAGRLAQMRPGELRWMLPLLDSLHPDASRIREIVPETVQGQECLARWLIQVRQWDEVLKVLDVEDRLNAARLEDEKPWTMGEVAYLKRELRSKDQVALDVDRMRLTVLEQAGRMEEAAVVRERLRNEEGRLGEDILTRADELIANGEWTLAEEMLKRRERDPRALVRLGEMALTMNRMERVGQVLRQLHEADEERLDLEIRMRKEALERKYGQTEQRKF